MSGRLCILALCVGSWGVSALRVNVQQSTKVSGYPANHEVMDNWYQTLYKWEQKQANFALHDSQGGASPHVVVWGVMIPEGYEPGTSDQWVRDIHRKSWMSQPGLCNAHDVHNKDCKGYKAFVIANKDQDKETRFKTTFEQAQEYPPSLKEEAEKYGDIVFLKGESENMRDGKSFAWFEYAARNYPYATHIAKVDSDAYPVVHMIYPKMPHVPISTSSLLERPGRKGSGYVKPNPADHIRQAWECHGKSPYQFIGNGKAKLVHGGSMYMMSKPLALGVTEDDSWWSANRENPLLGEDKTTSIGVIEFHNQECVDDISIDGAYMHGGGCWPHMADFHTHCLEFSENFAKGEPFTPL